ncbi:MFS transporter [Pseudomonas putida]
MSQDINPSTAQGHRQWTKEKTRAWTVTMMVVVFATINWADKAIIGITARALQEDLGLTSTQIGFAGSAFFFLFSISGAAVGFLGDRLQVRWILFALAFAWGVIQLPLIVSSTFTVLLATRIVLGAAEGPATAMANTAVFQWFPPERRAFPAALVTSGSSIAKIAIAPILALILAYWGWRACFIAMGFASFIWCALWFFIGKEGPYSRNALIEATDRNKPSTRAPAEPVRVPLKKILLTRSFIGALLGSFSVYGIVAASVTWIPSYFEVGLGYSRLESGLMFGLPSLAALVLMFCSTLISDQLSSRNFTARTTRVITTSICMLIGGVALAMLPLFKTPIMVVCALVLGYGLASIAIPMMNAVVSQITPSHQMASTLGIFLALQNLSGFVAPVLVGVLVDRAATPLDGYSLAYQIFGLALLVGAAAIGILVNPERDAEKLKKLVGGLQPSTQSNAKQMDRSEIEAAHSQSS